MTGEEFRSQFQLLRRVTSEGARTFHSVGPGGMVCMVHVLEDQAARDEVQARLELLDGPRRERVLELLDVEGSPVLVTKFILDFESLERWLGAPPVDLGAAAEGAADVPASTPAEDREPDPTAPSGPSFTDAFEVAEPASAEARSPSAASEDATQVTEPVQADSAGDTGTLDDPGGADETQRIDTLTEASATVPPTHELPTEPPPEPAGGSFTQAFGAVADEEVPPQDALPGPPAQEAVPNQGAAQDAPGSFTAQFDARGSAAQGDEAMSIESADAPTPPPDGTSPRAEPSSELGESPATPSGPATPRPQEGSEPGSFTRQFQAQPGPGPSPASPPKPAEPGPPPTPSTPWPSAAPPPEASPPPPPPPREPEGPASDTTPEHTLPWEEDLPLPEPLSGPGPGAASDVPGLFDRPFDRPEPFPEKYDLGAPELPPGAGGGPLPIPPGAGSSGDRPDDEDSWLRRLQADQPAGADSLPPGFGSPAPPEPPAHPVGGPVSGPSEYTRIIKGVRPPEPSPPPPEGSAEAGRPPGRLSRGPSRKFVIVVIVLAVVVSILAIVVPIVWRAIMDRLGDGDDEEGGSTGES